MHLQFWSLLVLLTFCYTNELEIQEPPSYGPRAVPTNIPKARQTLGYDKYEKQTVDSSQRAGRKVYPYGNNWEDFDVPSFSYNFRSK